MKLPTEDVASSAVDAVIGALAQLGWLPGGPSPGIASNLYGNLFEGSLAAGINKALNGAQLAALTDATVHVSNLAGALFTRPGVEGGGLISDTLLSAFGRADLPIKAVRAIRKAFSDNRRQIAEIAEIGALRDNVHTWNPISRFVHWADRITRLVLDDTYRKLDHLGIVEGSETARREFVNQVGQYNKRLQGIITATLRNIGVSPFITAGKTFNAMGLRNITLSPGVRAGSLGAATLLRANVAAKWVGTLALIGTINYLLTKDKGGGVMGRPGTPLGRIDTGLDDHGKPLTVPALDIAGFGRGLRVTGARRFVESKRLGLPNQTAIDGAASDIINSWSSPVLGPSVRFATAAATGYQPARGVPRATPVVPPGENQLLSDTKHALIEANPLVSAIHRANQPGGNLRDALQTQIPRFTMQPGKTPEVVERYPKIVEAAQANEFLEDVIRRARKLPDIKVRLEFLRGEIFRLPPAYRERAANEIMRRHVLAP